MKRNLILATIAATTLIAVPAMAQPSHTPPGHGYDDALVDRAPILVPMKDRRVKKQADVIKPEPTWGGRGFDDSAWVKSRGSRRTNQRASIFNRWNRRFLRTPAARAELARHAKRMARLNRISRLIAYRGDFQMKVRVRRAIAKENARHDRAMNRLMARYEGTRTRGHSVSFAPF